VKDRGHTNDAGHSDVSSDEPRTNGIGTIERCSMAESTRSLAQTLGPQPADTRVLPVARPPFAGPEEPFEGTEVHTARACVASPGDDRRRASMPHEGATDRAFREKSTTRRDPKHFWLEGIRAIPDDELSTDC
jgi:hypothetical protein